MIKVMKLWLLKAKNNLPEGDNPWEPWYDKAFGFVVNAENESEARKFANEKSGDENRGEFMNGKIADTTEPWLDEKYSTCEILTADRDAGVVLIDFHAA